MSFEKLLLLISVLFVSAAAHGQTALVGWDFNGVTESTGSLTAATFGSNISNSAPSGVLSRGSGAALPGGTPLSSAFGASGFTATTLAGALSASDYFSFSITVNAGNSMSLTSILMRLSTTTNAPTNAALFSSVGGFTQATDAIQTFALTSNAINDQTVTLSSGSFSNLTGNVEFRLYAYGGGSSSTDKLRFRSIGGDDLVVNGTVSTVPEPSTYAAIGGAVALIAAVYRRRSTRRSK